MRQERLANVKLILDFCVRKKMSVEDCLYFSTTPIHYDDFRWFYQKAQGKIPYLKGYLVRRQEKIERNRRQGYSYLPPEAL